MARGTPKRYPKKIKKKEGKIIMKNMVSVKNLSTKDKMIIVKAIKDLTDKIYKDNTEFVLNQVLKNGNYESNYGQFYKKTTNAKTIQDTIEDTKAKIAKLQEELTQLEAIEDKTAIAKDASTTLMSKHTQVADNIAIEILQDIISDLDSKRLGKSASKIANTMK